jgi:hypothetical protein
MLGRFNSCATYINKDLLTKVEVELFNEESVEIVECLEITGDNKPWSSKTYINVYIFEDKIEYRDAETFDDFYILYDLTSNINLCQRYYFRYGKNEPFRIDTNTFANGYNDDIMISLDERIFNFVNVDGYYYPSIQISKYFHEYNKYDFYIPEYLYKMTNMIGYATEEEALKFPYNSYFSINKCNINKRYRMTKSARK